MEKYTQQEIAKRLLEVVDLMYFLDDGHHIKEYGDLVWICNGLYSRLTEANQKKFHAYMEKKSLERIES
jgi:hypothetical protein